MAEDFVELGFEGFDRAVDKYYDKGYDRFSKRKFLQGHRQEGGHIFRAKSQPPKDRHRSDDEDVNQRRRDSGTGTRQGGNSNRGRSPAKTVSYPRSGEYANDRGAQGGEYAGRRQSLPASQVAQQDSYQAYRFQPELGQDQQLLRGPSQRLPYQYPYPYPQNRYFEQQNLQDYRGAGSGRRHSVDGSRDSSPYSDDQSSRPRRQRKRSKSPQEKSLATLVLGALAGGVAGNELNKGDALTTVAGAVIGAVGAREVEKRRERRRER